MEYYSMFDFTGGWVDDKPPALLAPNELERADNVRILPGGGWQMRPGYDAVGNDDSVVKFVSGLFMLPTTPGDDAILVRTKNSKIEYLNSNTWTDITGAVTITTEVSSDVLHCVGTRFRNYLVGTTGENVPWKWNGTGNAATIAQAIGGGADTITRAKAICSHRERVVLGDVTAVESAVTTRYESVIWPSDAGTLDTWSASPTGKIHLGQGDGDSITCLLSHLGKLVVFKQHSLWSISDHGSSTQVATKIADVGTPSRKGAIVVEDKIYFISSAGLLYSYNPRAGDTPDALTEHTRGKMTRPAQLVSASAKLSHLVFHEATGQILVFVQDTRVSSPSGSNNCAWVFNRDLECWSRWIFDKRITAAIYGKCTVSSAIYELFLGTHDGFVGEEEDDGVDMPGNTIAVAVTHAPIDCGSPGTIKQWDWAYIYTNVHGSTSTNAANAVTLYQDSALPAESTGQSYSVTLPSQPGASSDMYDRFAEQRLTGYGRAVRFRVTHTGSTLTDLLRFSGILIGYTPTGDRR